MGSVYEAVDERLHREVAIKIMSGQYFGNREALRRFDREARAVARLSHPNIVSVFDYGPLEGQGAFLVMERLHGLTLRATLANQKRYPPTGALAWSARLIEAVAAAHSQNIIHRDLKPENVIVIARTGAPDSLKVLDFGLATFRTTEGPESLRVSGTGMMMGTPAYMAPEQMLGQATSAKSDLFSLAIVLYEIVTGVRPFAAHPLDRLSEIARGLPGSALDGSMLRHVLARCLEEDPGRRYATVADAQHDLAPALQEFVTQHRQSSVEADIDNASA
jgi:serine/threonine-protein kinase